MSEGRAAEVVLDLELQDGALVLVLANCGDAAATDVSVAFSPALRGIDGSALGDLPVFRGLGMLRPGREVRVLWSAPGASVKGGSADPFVATVSWNERERGAQRAAYRHDPAVWRRLPEIVS